ncbi:MAG: hypothetical protein V4437_00690 [Patescibacteria group bacterium]
MSPEILNFLQVGSAVAGSVAAVSGIDLAVRTGKAYVAERRAEKSASFVANRVAQDRAQQWNVAGVKFDAWRKQNGLPDGNGTLV